MNPSFFVHKIIYFGNEVDLPHFTAINYYVTINLSGDRHCRQRRHGKVERKVIESQLFPWVRGSICDLKWRHFKLNTQI